MILIISFFFNNRTNSSTIQFSVNYYEFFYLGLFHVLGGLIILYILYEIYYILKKRSQMIKLYESKNANEQKVGQIVISLINHHLLYLGLFLVSYMPNNIIKLAQLFLSYKICEDCGIFYTLPVYLLSSSCTISLIIKLLDPYTKKYFSILYKIMLMKINKEEAYNEINKQNDEEADISNVYTPDGNSEVLLHEYLNDDFHKKSVKLKSTRKAKLHKFNQNASDDQSVEMQDLEAEEQRHIDHSVLTPEPKQIANTIRKISNIDVMANTFDELNKQLNLSDHIIRLIAMSIAIDEDKTLQIIDKLLPIPWDQEPERSFYQLKSDYKSYSKKNFPYFLDLVESDIYYHSEVKIRKYASIVFKDIRERDGLYSGSMIDSLDYKKNSNHLSEAFASGGRSANPILYTYDRKYLIKTISKNEKNILVKMLPEFHRRMHDENSLLCRIYGLYKIQISDKQSAHIIIMRNMCELSVEVI